MKTFDYSPFYRSTVGFDRLFDMLDNSVRPDWPPYDIEKLSDNEYRISMAVAGFNQDEIELTQTGTELQVTGQKKSEDTNRQILHRGIAQRNFKQTFNLASHVKVAGATLENGLLSVDLIRELPSSSSHAASRSVQTRRPPQRRTTSPSRSNRTPRLPSRGDL